MVWFNSVNVLTRRLGGGYGGKISRATLVAAACAIAANELSKPVRVALDLDSSMAIMGGRLPYYCHYKVNLQLKAHAHGIIRHDIIIRLVLTSKGFCKQLK